MDGKFYAEDLLGDNFSMERLFSYGLRLDETSIYSPLTFKYSHAQVRSSCEISFEFPINWSLILLIDKVAKCQHHQRLKSRRLVTTIFLRRKSSDLWRKVVYWKPSRPSTV